MSRYLRYLRIAFSVTCGIACLLLIVLWVRSYKSNDVLEGHLIGVHNFILTSIESRVNLTAVDIAYARLPWNITSQAADDWPRHQIPLWPRGSQFGLKREIDHFDVVAPHWCCVLLSATLAAAPWLRWPKRFSLRTLLIATTLVAVVLGLVVMFSR